MSDTKKEAKKCTSNAGEIGTALLTGAIVIPILLTYFSFGPALFAKWLGIDEKSPMATDPVKRLLFTLRWLAPICITVIVCIQLVATSRLLTASIDGQTPHWLTDMLRSVLQNTFEQAFMMTLNLLALSQNVSPSQLVWIPMLVALFVVARVLFTIGYFIWPTRRALGFILTFWPNVITAVYNVYCLVSFRV